MLPGVRPARSMAEDAGQHRHKLPIRLLNVLFVDGDILCGSTRSCLSSWTPPASRRTSAHVLPLRRAVRRARSVQCGQVCSCSAPVFLQWTSTWPKPAYHRRPGPLPPFCASPIRRQQQHDTGWCHAVRLHTQSGVCELQVQSGWIAGAKSAQTPAGGQDEQKKSWEAFAAVLVGSPVKILGSLFRRMRLVVLCIAVRRIVVHRSKKRKKRMRFIL